MFDLSGLYRGQVDVWVTRGWIDAVGNVVLAGVLWSRLREQLIHTLPVEDTHRIMQYCTIWIICAFFIVIYIHYRSKFGDGKEFMFLTEDLIKIEIFCNSVPLCDHLQGWQTFSPIPDHPRRVKRSQETTSNASAKRPKWLQ